MIMTLLPSNTLPLKFWIPAVVPSILVGQVVAKLGQVGQVGQVDLYKVVRICGRLEKMGVENVPCNCRVLDKIPCWDFLK